MVPMYKQGPGAFVFSSFTFLGTRNEPIYKTELHSAVVLPLYNFVMQTGGIMQPKVLYNRMVWYVIGLVTMLFAVKFSVPFV